MEDIDSCLCKIIQDLTFGSVETLREMKEGYLLSNLLNRIDSQFFYMSKKLENWTNVKVQLEQYLSEKGLQNQVLDFDTKGISDGAIEHLISAVLQVLAIFAAFNESEWLQLSEQFELMQKNLILPILNPMIADIAEERQQVPKKEEMKTLLLSLESRETELASLRRLLQEKDEKLQDTTKEMQALTHENKKLQSELEDLHQLKAETIKQIEEFYANKDDRESDNEFANRLKRAIAERDEFADKLFRLQLVVADKENEIEKLTLVKNAYENKKSDIESYTEQLHYYKTKNEQLKTDVEIKDSKLNALEHADIQITKLRGRVKELTTKVNKMKLEKIENDNSIRTMEKRLVMANEKVEFVRRKSASVMEPCSDLMEDSVYMSKLEEENGKLKQKVSSLLRELSDGDIERIENDLMDKENMMEVRKSKGMLLHSKSATSQLQNNTADNQKHSQDLANAVLKSPGKPLDIEKERLSLASMSVNSLMEEKRDQTESMDLLYSVCMQVLQKDMMRSRVLAPTYDERKRNIFKQFNLSNVMNMPNKYQY